MQGLDLKGTDVELSLLEVIIETGCFGNLSRVPLPIPNSCSASKDGAGRSAGPMRHSLTVPTISFNGSGQGCFATDAAASIPALSNSNGCAERLVLTSRLPEPYISRAQIRAMRQTGDRTLPMSKRPPEVVSKPPENKQS